jgi:Bacterial extracellular solute-binding proteins, family 3
MAEMNRRLVASALAAGGALAALAAPRPAAAQAAGADKLSEILARGKLIVGTGNDIPPFYFLDQNGQFAGMEIDLARLLAKGLFNDSSKVEFVAQTSDAHSQHPFEPGRRHDPESHRHGSARAADRIFDPLLSRRPGIHVAARRTLQDVR